jgi:Uma2 family endonuclease
MCTGGADLGSTPTRRRLTWSGAIPRCGGWATEGVVRSLALRHPAAEIIGARRGYTALMAVGAQRIPTFDELYEAILALPEGVTGEILSDGVIETMGRPGRAHRTAASILAGRLGGIGGRQCPGWVIESEVELRFAGDRLAVPDLVGWRLADGDDSFLDDNPVIRVPDWTCEILSASTERKDRSQKLPLYARASVGHIWVVDPDTRFLEVYASRDGLPVQFRVAREHECVVLPPFDLQLDLGELWLRGR